jgi:putative Ca2+/H+ antiporter (TMEM165/GDT1 family)
LIVIFFATFGVVFIAEIVGDKLLYTTGVLAARYHLALVVWAGAVAAMITKGTLAAFLGVGIRRWIHDRVSPAVVRYVAVSLLLFLCLLSVTEILY